MAVEPSQQTPQLGSSPSRRPAIGLHYAPSLHRRLRELAQFCAELSKKAVSARATAAAAGRASKLSVTTKTLGKPAARAHTKSKR